MCIKIISYFVFINLLLMSDIFRYFLCELLVGRGSLEVSIGTRLWNKPFRRSIPIKQLLLVLNCYQLPTCLLN